MLRLRTKGLIFEKKGHSVQRNPEDLDHLGLFVCFGVIFSCFLKENEHYDDISISSYEPIDSTMHKKAVLPCKFASRQGIL